MFICPRHVRIPMSPHVDSLNVGVAVGVLLHSTLKGVLGASDGLCRPGMFFFFFVFFTFSVSML